MSTRIAVPLLVHNPERALADAHLAKDLGADLVEFRLEEMLDDEHTIPAVCDLIADAPLPVIATCRPAWEGGSTDLDEELRQRLFERLIRADHPPRFLDIELAAFDRTPDLQRRIEDALHAAGDRAPSIIASIHDFAAPPGDLARRLIRLAALDVARVHKIAFRARSPRDNLIAFDILQRAQRPTIALAMGEFGLMSRVLAPKFGAFLTFASLRPTTTTAPGQPTIRELLDLYRFRSITPRSRVFAVVGWPVAHSLSPPVHNAAFEQMHEDAVYLPLPINPGKSEGDRLTSLKATLLELLACEPLALSGLSVTIPFKESLVALAREQGWDLDRIAERTGSANTLIGRTDPSVANTDVPAVVACLARAGVEIEGTRICVLGAGGVGRALAIALADGGAHVVVTNRTPARAHMVVRDALALRPTIAGSIACADEPPPDARVYINATSLGMTSGPAPDQSPLDEPFVARLEAGTVVLDTVYRKDETPLLALAKKHGLTCIAGLDMFVEQAIRQLEHWTGTTPPRGLIEIAAREAIDA